jgi:RND family efflux transporter MFP subunit
MELVWVVNRMKILPVEQVILPLAAILSLGLSLVGCDGHPSAQAATTTPSSVSAPQPVASALPSSTAAADANSSQESSAFRTTGPLVADQQSDVAAELDGRVVRINVQIGDRVRRGQVLASLDDRALRAAVDAQTAHLASLRAQVAEWQAEAKMDGADLRRADQMRDARIMSEESWEHVKYKLDEVLSEVERYQADEIATESDLRAARLKLEQCQVVAPFSGIVGRESLRLAQEVKKGDVLFWVTAEAPLKILFTVPESAMSSFPPGAALALTTPDYPGLRQGARIQRVSRVVDPASGSVQIIGELIHPSPLLKPGMSMQVELASSTQSSHLGSGSSAGAAR